MRPNRTLDPNDPEIADNFGIIFSYVKTDRDYGCLTLARNGWHAESLDWLDPDEVAAVMKSVQSINGFVSGIMSKAVRAAVPMQALLAM